MTHDTHRTFRDFVVDRTNARAVAALRRWTWCANAAPAALLISGPSGVGKSHLLHATAGALRARRRVVMLTAEAWMQAYVTSIRRGDVPAFRASMVAACDALFVDGLEDLAAKPVTLAALGAISKQVIDHAGLVVLACGAAATPAIMEVLGEVLAPRIIEVQAPSTGLRYAVIARVQTRSKLRVPRRALRRIAQAARSTPEAMGMLNRCVLEEAARRHFTSMQRPGTRESS